MSSFKSIKDKIVEILSSNEATNIIYLITITIGRYTKEEMVVLEDILKNQREMMKNVMIIFTSRSELIGEHQLQDRSVAAWIKKNPSLLHLIKDNKLKYRAFENKRLTAEENDLQIKDLLSVVDGVDKKGVSWNMNMENKICMDKETMVETFGECWRHVYEVHRIKQNNK